VTFREDIPYALARQRGNAQDAILMEICRRPLSIEDLNLEEVLQEVQKATSK
jgi:kynurenine 3-monooxygenase